MSDHPCYKVVIGDHIRFSVTLLRELYDRPEHESVVVELAGVRTEPDGCKVLVLQVVQR